MIKNNFRILKKTHANLQTIAKAPVKFQKDWPKTVGGVEGTRYLLKIRNHAPRTTHYGKPKTMSLRFSSKRRGTKSGNTIFPIIRSTGVFLRCQMAANSIVGGPIWPKFELIHNIMHVLVTSKFEKDRININRDYVMTSIF